ncbi:MAG TPA: cobalamin-dependent protein [bacterium]|nr:cobalamin-dependent protein [bacterium]
MTDTILLINPNTRREPPVIPLGLEIVGSALERAGHNIEMLDLCFVSDPVGAAAETARRVRPLFAGVTVRNVDSAIFDNNEYFIPGIAEIVQAVRNEGTAIVLGGAGFSAMPELVLKETGADFGISGPAEKAIVDFADAMKSGATPEKIIDGFRTGIDPAFVPDRPFKIDYQRYIANRGIIGFNTQYGCAGRCEYCIEAGTKVIHREPAAVVREITGLRELGFRDFHLCDCEFNLKLDFSERFAGELAAAEPDISWVAYMKPAPVSERLFSLMKKSGVIAITLSVDSVAPNSPDSAYSFDDVTRFIRLCRENDIKLAVDLLTGLPGEPVESTVKTLDFFRKNRPDTVGASCHVRVYPGTKTHSALAGRDDMAPFLTRPPDDSLLDPVFYNHLPTRRLKEMTADDPLFKIEGFENSSNYERLK